MNTAAGEGWVTVAEFERRHQPNADWVRVAGGVANVARKPEAIRTWLADRGDTIRVETTWCDGPSAPDSCDYPRILVQPPPGESC